jgi:hypothetical protein
MSDLNREYCRWFQRKRVGLRARLVEKIKKYNDMVEAALRQEQKKRQPRQRKYFEPLPDDVVAQIRSYYVVEAAEAKGLRERLELFNRTRERRLAAMAGNVQLFVAPRTWCRLQVSDADDFRTIGLSCNKYAYEALRLGMERLKSAGFTYEVYGHLRQHTEPRSHPGSRTLPSRAYYCYELWANCDPWQYDVMARTMLTSLESIIDQCARHNVNAQAMYPALRTIPFSRFDLVEQRVLARHKKEREAAYAEETA